MISADSFRAIVSGQQRELWASAVRFALALAERPYALAMRIRNRRYDRQPQRSVRVEVPVLSVGNITLGGTGKTPMVIWLARWFRQAGIRVSIISRGYGQLADGANDEARQLEACLPDVPHLQNADRIQAAQTAIEELDTQLILLDDGFQHRRLQRDLDLVLIDATEPFGYEHVFPRGLLREPLTGLQRADVVALTRANLVSEERRATLGKRLQQLAPQAIQMEVAQSITELASHSGHSQSMETLRDTPVLAFCGIGNPDAFRQTLEALGAQLVDFRAFPDHHAYDAQNLRSLVDWVQQHREARMVLCTHKDLVKLQVDRLGPLPLLAAMLDLHITRGAEAFTAKLQQLAAAVVDD